MTDENPTKYRKKGLEMDTETNNDLFGAPEPGADIDRLIDYAAAADEDEVKRWQSTLTEFVDLWQAALQRRENMSADDAGRIARQLVAETASYYGGRAFYLPKDDRLKRALRDAQIWHDSHHKSHAQLAREHRLTVTAIYMILAKQKKLRTSRLQADMFSQSTD